MSTDHQDRSGGSDGSVVAVAAVPATGSSPAAVRLRDAILFIPGLNTLQHRSQAHVMEVLCNELDHAARTDTARFAVRPSSAKAGDDVELVRTIWRIDGEDSVPVADVYWLDYDAIQRADTTPTNPLARVFTLALAVLAGVLIWVAAWFRRNRRAKPGPRWCSCWLVC